MRSIHDGRIEEGSAAAYAVAIAAVGATFLVRLALWPVLGDRGPFVLFVLPVVFSVFIGGRGPGIAAGLLSFVLGHDISSEPWTSPQLIVSGILFLLVCAAIGWLGVNISRHRRRAAENKSLAEANAREAAAVGEELNLLLEGATSYAIFMVD